MLFLANYCGILDKDGGFNNNLGKKFQPTTFLWGKYPKSIEDLDKLA